MSKYKYIFRLLQWALLMLYLFVILGFIRRERNQEICHELTYQINKEHAFVDTLDLYQLLMQDSLYPLGLSVQNLHLLDMESCLEAHEAIKNAEAYYDMNGVVHISVMQRNPVLRIITRTNMNYYVDEELGLMSVGYNYTADVPVLSGFVNDTLITAFRDGNDSLHSENAAFCMRDIITFADYLYQDEFWRNMFVQIYINDNYEFELVPRIGNQIIILGDLENYKYKMKKLRAVYKEAFPKYGWQDYKTINLKYSNQVVCSK